MNETVRRPNWMRRNLKWLLPVVLIIAATSMFIISLPDGVGNATLNIAKGYIDLEVAEKALEIVGENERVNQMLGELEPIGKLTILEGYVKYSKDADSLLMALTIKGNKGKGKMDIKASKNNGAWKYDTLNVRLKAPAFRKETIPVFP